MLEVIALSQSATAFQIQESQQDEQLLEPEQIRIYLVLC
jgi:hypothetical protein